jgi:lipid-binding SYLF domain-containing protein
MNLSREQAKAGFPFTEPDRLLLDERAAFYFYATYLPKVLGGGSFYLIGLNDKSGTQLNGRDTYKLTVPRDTPAKDFWSAIVYSMKTKGFVEGVKTLGLSSQDLGRMKRNADGSVDVYFAPAAPAGMDANWVPTGIATPDQLETRLGTLRLRDGIPDAQTAQKVYDNSMQVASMSGLRTGHLEVGPANRTVLVLEDLMDSKALWLTPNTVNIYMSAWLELGDEPARELLRGCDRRNLSAPVRRHLLSAVQQSVRRRLRRLNRAASPPPMRKASMCTVFDPARRHAVSTFTTAAITVALACAIPAISAAAEKGKTGASQLASEAKVALNRLYGTVPAAKSIGAKAHAVLVFPSVTKAGLGIGGQYGEGALLEGGQAVAYYSTAGLSYGLQAGAQTYGYAMFFMNAAALKQLDKADGFEVGVGPSVVVVDEGMAKSTTTTTYKDDIYAFIFGQKGLMAGLGVQGNKISRIDPK